jgi:hypothetical protein
VQEPLQRLARVEGLGVEPVARAPAPRRVPLHARRAAEQVRDGHVDDALAGAPVGDGEPAVVGRLADNRPGAAFAAGERDERVQRALLEGEDVALLGLVAPDLERRHAGLVARHAREVDASAAGREDFRHRVRQPAGADVVDHQDGVSLAHRPAGVDDLLGAALHLGVAALH